MTRLAPKDFIRSAEAAAVRYTIAEAEAYTRWLATHHYENFQVVSFLLPKRLHQDFYNVYAYCRWADDLGDEMGSPAESLRLLAWWREQLRAMYAGEATHPVFVALRGTVTRHAIPQEPFADLIRAFEQDQTVTRYATWDDVYGVLPLLRESGGTPGALSLRLLRSRSGSASPTPPARRCNSPISGRTSPSIWKRTACTFRSKCWRGTATRLRISTRGA